MALASTAAVKARDMTMVGATSAPAYQMAGHGVIRRLMIVRITERKSVAIGRMPMHVGIESVKHVIKHTQERAYGAAATTKGTTKVIRNIAALELLPENLGHVKTPAHANGDVVIAMVE